MDLQFWIVVAVVGYVLIILLLYFLQHWFFYHPEKLPPTFRFSYTDRFQEVTIDAEDGNRISGILFQVDNPQGVVLYFKGNTRSIKGWSKFRRDFLDNGYDFFIFDYPGFGKSTGHHTQIEIFTDTEAVYAWLTQRYPEEDIIIYGRSLGSGFATRIAAHHRPRLLILDAPYYSIRRLADYYSWIIPTRLILKLQLPLYQFLGAVACPVAILHGDRDRVIPFRFSQQLAAEYPAHVTLYPIPGARHNNLLRFPTYHQILATLLTPPSA